jgi:hypothetical protein
MQKLYQSYRTYELSKLVKRSLCLVTPCTLAGYCQRFRRTDRLKTSVGIDKITWRHNSQGHDRHSYSLENLKTQVT